MSDAYGLCKKHIAEILNVNINFFGEISGSHGHEYGMTVLWDVALRSLVKKFIDVSDMFTDFSSGHRIFAMRT